MILPKPKRAQLENHPTNRAVERRETGRPFDLMIDYEVYNGWQAVKIIGLPPHYSTAGPPVNARLRV
jgi:hypothetical protein